MKSSSLLTRSKLRGIAILIAAAAASPVVASTSTYTDTATNGLWTTAGSWSPSGVPGSYADVVLGSASASVSTLSVTYNYNQAAAQFYNSLTLNSSGLTGNMIVNQSVASSNLSANTETIGTTTPDNQYIQSAGTNTTTSLNLGNTTSSYGNY